MSRAVGRRVIALVSDAFGGRGGIALYDRYFLRATCSHPDVKEVIALPRAIYYDLEALPPEMRYVTSAAGGIAQFTAQTVALLGRVSSADLIVCGLIHLLPFARMLGARFGCPVLPLVYGYEAWHPSPHWSANALCRSLKGFVAIRRLTAERLMDWSRMRHRHYYYLPNCIDETEYGIAPRRADLVERFRLAGRKVVMTTGRMDTMGYDQRKGFDEMIEALPLLAQQIPNVTYLIMGDGDDRPRLEQKAVDLGVRDRLTFTGYVPEGQKADYFRLADVFAMPGSNPVFDTYPFRFVYLEALACGVPVVAAQPDPSERDDPDAKALIVQVDPNDTEAIVRGVLSAMTVAERGINPVLPKFYYRAFERRTHAIISAMINR